MSDLLTNESRKWLDSRRSQRVLIQMPLQVRWNPPGEEAITEDTHSIVVNAHGALIALALRVKPGNKIILRNWGTAKERECRVVHVRPKPGTKNEVGITLLVPDASFWGVEFPPDDWQPYSE